MRKPSFSTRQCALYRLTEQHTPFYLDWTFRVFVVAAIAVVLFQRPPLNILLRRAKLEVEAYSTLALFRKLVNPNAQLNLIITNTGGRRIKIAPKRKPGAFPLQRNQ